MNIPVYKIMLVRETSQDSEGKQINNPGLAAEVLQKYLEGTDREIFVVLLLNTKNKIVGINTVSIGSLDSSLVHPREVFKPAVLASAASVILGHNHPSGDPAPSNEDLEISRRLVEAGNILGINVRDHIIIGDNCHVSLKERGNL